MFGSAGSSTRPRSESRFACRAGCRSLARDVGRLVEVALDLGDAVARLGSRAPPRARPAAASRARGRASPGSAPNSASACASSEKAARAGALRVARRRGREAVGPHVRGTRSPPSPPGPRRRAPGETRPQTVLAKNCSICRTVGRSKKPNWARSLHWLRTTASPGEEVRRSARWMICMASPAPPSETRKPPTNPVRRASLRQIKRPDHTIMINTDGLRFRHRALECKASEKEY